MSVELLQTLSTATFILAAVLFFVGVALFFLLDIKRVIGDVSGSTAKKAIENIRQQNEDSGNKAYKPSPVNKSRGRVTDKISQSGQIQNAATTLGVAVGTSELGRQQFSETASQHLASSDTTVLENSEIANAYISDTTVLKVSSPLVFAVEYEIGFCGSSEIIE